MNILRKSKKLCSILFLCCVSGAGLTAARAATFTVSDASDAGAGSLRQAIANATATAGDDEIIFDAAFFSTPRTINLVNELSVTGGGNLTIRGPGIDFLEIVNPLFAPTQPARYAVNVANAQLTLRNLKLRGVVVSNNASAIIEQVRFNVLGIVNFGTTTINDSIMSNCGSSLNGGGAGNSGTMVINRSTIANNSARNGGGIANSGGSLIVNYSIISGNRAMLSGTPNPSGRGGGIYLVSSTVTINNSIIKNNVANGGGGVTGDSGSLNIYNSTVTGNSASGNGAGINCPGTFGGLLINSTVIGNLGGTDVLELANIFKVGNSILGSHFGSFNSLGYNILVNAANIIVITGTTTGNQLNVNPQLAPLAGNGGTTETFALLQTSPAINAGNNALAVDAANNRFTTDQRGGCFRRITGAAVDIGAYESQIANNPAACVTRFDYDADGRADVSVFRPSTGAWYISRSSNNGFSAVTFGQNGDQITPADYDGDGNTDIAVFRDGIWYWLNSSNGSFSSYQFGIASDIPVPADFTGDGRAELAVYRGGTWYIWNLANNQFNDVQFGISTDKPIPADYDGDGKTDFAVYRDGIWYMLRSAAGFAAVQFGIASDKPTVGDYDGDAKADQAVYRAGVWYVLGSTQGFSAVQFGIASDIPVAADYDGDGKTDVAVFRDGVWYLLRSQQGFGAVQFGMTNDRPIPAAFVP